MADVEYVFQSYAVLCSKGFRVRRDLSCACFVGFTLCSRARRTTGATRFSASVRRARTASGLGASNCCGQDTEIAIVKFFFPSPPPLWGRGEREALKGCCKLATSLPQTTGSIESLWPIFQTVGAMKLRPIEKLYTKFQTVGVMRTGGVAGATWSHRDRMARFAGH